MALTKADVLDDARLIGCSPEVVMAVAQVESSGSGFNPDKTPCTLFEGHWFHRYTKGKFAATRPDLCYPVWTKQFYGRTWQAEQARLTQAVALDRTAALMSTSFGAFQVMGFNFSVCGYKTLQQFVNAMFKDENSQLEAFTNYVIHSGLSEYLKKHEWDAFALHYNGVEYRKNAYSTKLAAAYAKQVAR